MAFKASADAKFFYHDLDLSVYLEGVDPTASADMATHKPMGGNAVRQLPGHKRLAVALTGIYDSDPVGDGEAETVWGALANAEVHPFSHLPEGDTVGSIAYCGISDLGSQQITAGEGFVKFPVAVVGSTQFDRGVVLSALTHKTTTAAGTTHNNGADSHNGGAGYIHCTDIDGGATLDVIVEHSDNGSDWTTLASFTQLAARGSERIVVAAGTTVKQYTRASHTLASGHATFAVAFARR